MICQKIYIFVPVQYEENDFCTFEITTFDMEKDEQNNNSNKTKKIGVGAIVGISIGALAFIVCLIIIIILIIKKLKNNDHKKMMSEMEEPTF